MQPGPKACSIACDPIKSRRIMVGKLVARDSAANKSHNVRSISGNRRAAASPAHMLLSQLQSPNPTRDDGNRDDDGSGDGGDSCKDGGGSDRFDHMYIVASCGSI